MECPAHGTLRPPSGQFAGFADRHALQDALTERTTQVAVLPPLM